jgi:uncharacterized membrane protein YkoI
MSGAFVSIVSTLFLTWTFCHAESLPGNRCYSDWSTAAAIVRKEKLVAMEQLHQIVRSRLSGELVKARLCHQGGRFVYQVIVRHHNGSIRSSTEDARRPFER